MKNAIPHVCARIFSRAILFTIFGAIAITLFSVHPALAVRVWNLGDNFEQPPGTPKGRPQQVVTGLAPDPATLAGQRQIKLRVIGAGSGEPVENAMAYLVRMPHTPQTVVFNTDSDGRTIIWDIEDCYRKLVVSDGPISVSQWVSLPPGCVKDIVVELPYKACVTATRPTIKCRKAHFYAFRKRDGVYEHTYKGRLCCKLLKVWLPGGTYQLMMDACDKNDDLIKRFVWDDVEVRDGKPLFVKAEPHIEMPKPFVGGKPAFRAAGFVHAAGAWGKPRLHR